MKSQSRLLEKSFEQFLKGIIIVYLKWLELIKSQLEKTSARNEKHSRLYLVKDEMVFKPYYCKTYMATRRIIGSILSKVVLIIRMKLTSLISKNGRKYSLINLPVMLTQVKINHCNRV